MRVLKFGGTSVGSPEMINRVVSILSDSSRGRLPQAVAVSAYKGVTNQLIALADMALDGSDSWETELETLATRHLEVAAELITDPAILSGTVMPQINTWISELRSLLKGIALLKECSPRTRDHVVSFGECFSAMTIAHAIKSRGQSAEFVNAREIIRTDNDYGAACVDFQTTTSLIKERCADNSVIYIVTGFIASDEHGVITTLGRGGTDYTAAILAYALDASVLEIWTDVDGVLTCDPRRVPKAFPLQELSYQEALELCHFGAKVIYPPTLQPVLQKKIPIRILNTFNPEAPGTLIKEVVTETKRQVTGISSMADICLVRVQGSGLIGVAGIAVRLFSALARNKINVILITQASSEHTICVAVRDGDRQRAEDALSEEFALELRTGQIDPIVCECHIALVSVVGEQMRKQPGIAGKVFGSLGSNGININAIAQGSSELNISVAINRSDEDKALIALHDEFFLSRRKTINLFVVGTGLIGSTLLEQLANHIEVLQDEYCLDISLAGLANSRKMIISPSGGIPFDGELLISKGSESSLEKFVSEMCTLNLPNSVFVDCTASARVTEFYRTILDSHISLVTPNKKAQSGPAETFFALRELSRLNGVSFLYETSVGAGLPVLSTLNDLRKSGDRITRIEAVLSGTLSYIFNTYDGTVPFSKIVKMAKDKGFTEPDPRDDLNGLDVARKLLILARESGQALEMDDLEVKCFLSDETLAAPTVDDFFVQLEKEDKKFEALIREAQSEDKRLCFVASLDGKTTTIQLQQISEEHPFFGLSGSDNIISFWTERYNERPLVVKGPGAGAQVTAAGVFSDIVRIASPLV